MTWLLLHLGRWIVGNFWVTFILQNVLAILQASLKNPAHVRGVEHIVLEVRDAAAELAVSLDPTVAPPPGYKPA